MKQERGVNKMIIEQLIFTFISFAIFVYMFFRMIKNNDTSYVFVLVIEAIGITLNFAEVLFGIKFIIYDTKIYICNFISNNNYYSREEICSTI